MSIVIFENPGEIDTAAISTFGVSVKEGDNPIGFFGTGLKYAIAILLRTGHAVSVQSGASKRRFALKVVTIRGQKFDVVTMDRRELGFTTQVGKTWELWMAYRELYCNCKDEGGSVYVADKAPAPLAGFTRVIVTGEAFRKEHDNRSSYILTGEPWVRLDGCDVYDGESRGVFYRGILVHRFPKAEVSKFTYNLTRPVDLTEDRTAKYPSFIPMYLAASILGAEDDAFLRDVLVVPNQYYEHHFDFRNNVWGAVKPTEKFIETVEKLSHDRAARTNYSAVGRYKEIKRAELTPATTVLVGVEAEILQRAIAFCKATLHLDIEKYPIILTDTLGAGILGMAEGGRIYVARQAFMQGTKRVVSTLLEEYVHLKYGYADETRELQDWLFDKVVSVGEEMRGEPL